jgi:AraC-like DNA-binding protein
MTTMVRASGIQGYTAVMRDLGADPAPILRRYRIPLASLDDDDALLSLRAVTHMLETSSTETGCADLGLRIAQTQDIGILGPLGIVIQNAATPNEALRLMSRYLFIHSPGLSLTIHDPSSLIKGAFEIVFEIRLSGHPVQRQAIDLCLGSLHRSTRLLLGEQYRIKAVTLPHAPIASMSTYRRFFGAPVIANQKRAALHPDSASWPTSLQGSNPALRRITEDYLSRHFRVPGDSATARVRMALRSMLGTPRANKEDIAAMLAIHPRTLHRRLQDEGSGFEIIKEELRGEMALQYLRQTKIPLGQLSDLLGFPEQSAFTRSCKRWFGKTPSAIRKESATCLTRRDQSSIP